MKHLLRYVPLNKNLRRLPAEEISLIVDSLTYLTTSLPYDIFWDVGDIAWFEDQGMNVDNGVMGAIWYTQKNRILLSPEIITNLKFVNNNESAMEIIVHELTHRAQMEYWWFPLCNIPFVNLFTIEKWAVHNGKVAKEILSKAYDLKRSEAK